nr:MAG: hypothetical protein B6I27_02675 [Erwiniaceae bacterium 4572_131]
MGKEDNFGDKKNTEGFDKRPENINKKGRPKKIYTILKNKGFSKDDITTAFKELSFYKLSELKKLFEDDNIPVILRIAANQFKEALQKGDMNKVKEMLEHVIGKPLQKSETDITSKGEMLNIPEIKWTNGTTQ